ncbi:hypothetical protein I551_3444 [Mycobacterium ulcerans str. Harvey]|uniref:RNA helicase HrpA C-terminal domain-containing protein n=1 Tax=Mycobacterium ulcerans str. Harvey TaxID=1299332 RepID=A0ABN0QZG9_MYCUL|nr:hypothetical protein I551_3444 [Mycobacterium ulcerans str. Harvey]
MPAFREELVTELIRSLPKDLRRNFVPAPDAARAVLAGIDPAKEPLMQALQRELRRRSGVLVPIDAFDLIKLPPHLRVNFAVESADGTEVARGKDLKALQAELAAPPSGRSPTRLPAIWNEKGCAPGPMTWTNWRASSSAASAGGPCEGSRGSSIKARTWTCGCSRHQPNVTMRWHPAPGGWCGSVWPHR